MVVVAVWAGVALVSLGVFVYLAETAPKHDQACPPECWCHAEAEWDMRRA